MKSHTKQGISSEVPNKRATSPARREQQLVALAVDLAEKQLREGTASAQVITHYLKLGSTRMKLENELLEQQKRTLEAKANAYEASCHSDELYQQALNAMRLYSGTGDDDE